MHKRIHFLWVAVLALLLSGSANGQAPATPAPSTNAPAATAPVGLAPGEIVTQADLVTTQLNSLDARLDAAKALKNVEERRLQISQRIDKYKPDSDEQLQASPSLATLRTTRTLWEGVTTSIADLNSTLSDRSTELDVELKQLGQWNDTWQATLAASSVKGAALPPEIIKRINDVIAAIGRTTATAKKLRVQILSAQTQVSELDSSVKLVLAEVDKKQKAAVDNLRVRDTAPLWEMDWTIAPKEKIGGPESPMLLQIRELQVYVKLKTTTFVVQFLIFIFLSIVFFRVREDARDRAKEDSAWHHTARISDAPIATAVLMSLLGSFWLYPQAPRLFSAIILAAMLIPAVIILRRLIEVSLFPILYAMVGFFFVDQWRKVIDSSEVLSRSLLLMELVAGILFVLWLLRSRRLSVSHVHDSHVAKLITVYARVCLLLFIFAGAAETLGYSHLAVLVGDATFDSAYLAIIAYAAVRILGGLTMTALSLWPFILLGMVRRHYLVLCQKLSRFYRWFFAFIWITATLELFSLRSPLLAQLSAFFSASIKFGADPQALSLPVGMWVARLVAFGLTVWAAFLISKFIRFILDEEVYPHLNLAPGVPYATSTMVHYAVLLLGFYGAMRAMNQDLSQFTILAGAFGVGLGFGLQNIMNNFVSGIILLFERPVKRGDVIQLGTDIGVVDRIGIRASVIQLDNGAEIIVPNGTLISGQVTNWTLTNRQRVIQIPVTVGPKADLQRVMALLIEIAKAQAHVMQSPEPEVLLIGFTPTAINFELRAWIGSFDEWMKIRSELSLSINLALMKENIPLV